MSIFGRFVGIIFKQGVRRKLCGIALSITLCALLCCALVSSYSAKDSFSAKAYALYCVNTGEILLEKNKDEELPIASTTKVMTSLLALEKAKEDNIAVEIDEAMLEEGSSMYLNPGEKVTLYDLAVGMMLRSGNDAANAAALTLAPSFDAFADMMNSRADEIGMEHTHFVTPSGLDAEGHYSSAYDMALLMKEAMDNSDFAYITAQSSMTVDFVSPKGKSVTYDNHNRLLKMYEYCIGGKTGYTSTAGRCLVSSAEKDGLRLIAVTLSAPDDWNDHIAMYDYGFENFAVVKPDSVLPETVSLVGAESDTLSVETVTLSEKLVSPDEAEKAQASVYIPAFVYAPVKKGEEVGRIIYSVGSKTVREDSLRASVSVPTMIKNDSFFDFRNIDKER